jgi:mannose-1-phosphate guanylyltransferase
MTQKRIWPVLLSGGVGARLWPVSRAAMPKQLISLTEAATMLQATAARCADGARYHPPLVVASAAHAATIGDQLAGIGAAPGALILEPVARNTAPAIALAALEVLRQDPAGLMLVMPSDHHIARPEVLQAAVATALPLAEAGWLVTFGITPDHPATGYGYIEIGDVLAVGVNKVVKFVEKPDVATATRWLVEGRHAWNGGIFLMRADVLLEELAQHAPAMRDACQRAFAAARRDGTTITPDAAIFAGCPADSIDYAVFEHAARVAVVPVAMGWSDIGSWDALRDLGPADGDGNVSSGNVIAVDTQRCLLRSDGPILATIGVHDLVIVATADAVLVSAAGQTQGVRKIVDRLAGDAALVHPRVESFAGGALRRLTEGDGVRVYEIAIDAGASWKAPAARVTVIAGAAEVAGKRLASADTVAGDIIVSASGARLLIVESVVKGAV